jgi:integrase
VTTAAAGRTVPLLAAPFSRKVAPRVWERHARECALSRRASRRCSCLPRYLARVEHNGREHSRAFPTLVEASSWAQATREILRAGGTFAARLPAPALADLGVSFVHHAKRGEALTRSRRPYGAQTLASYEVALRLRVLQRVDGRSGLTFGELPADAIDARTMQSLVDAIAANDSAARARVAAAALAAVLRFGFERGYVDNLPPRVALPPPPPGRKRRLELDDAAKLLEAARADDERRRRSLLEPLVALLVASGLRLSEALALVWGSDGLDLSNDAPLARVRHAKTPAGVREVALEQDTARVLRRHRLACGRPFDGSPVFADEEGKPLNRHGRRRVAGANPDSSRTQERDEQD